MSRIAALSIDGVSHHFGAVKAVSNVTLQVGHGRFTALLGINGAGKSTIFNLVTRLYATRTGRISVCGADLGTETRAALASLGVIFQNRSLDAALSVAENIAYFGALRGMRRRDALARGAATLERVGLSNVMKTRVGTLSGGQARRAEIACALLHQPKLLLCDEATVGLDVKARASIVADVHRLASEEGVGVLWATHLVDEIAPEDDVVILHQGEVRAAGRARDIANGAALSDAFLALTGADS